MTVHETPEGYEATVGQMARLRDIGTPAGDPARAAEILVEVAKRADIPDHLPLGVNAATMALALDRRLLADDETWAGVARSADFSEPYPIELPADLPATAPAQR